MSFEDRPNPDEILKTIKNTESSPLCGKLKIFLGMAAGVGKTFSMLEEAQALSKEGVDLLVGVIETHGREETAKLVKNLKVVPKKQIFYKEKQFEEMDLDTILLLHPQIVLVDELAHTNIPGSRHPKRWEDVIEILEKGIDVYTTLNVQHIESLNDVIEGITEIPVRETVPDSLIERASSIQLVDLTPEELLQRLKEGKVYTGNQSKVAALNFFQKERITALREIVLRYVAEKVDKDLHKIVSPTNKITGWKPREKLLVAISPSPHSQKLIRTTRRLAFNLDALWIALYVNNGKPLSETDQTSLEKNLALARQLGAEVISTTDPNIAETIERIAKQKSISQIILGRSPKKFFFGLFKKVSILDKISAHCPNIDLHIVKQDSFSTSYQKKLSFIKLKNQIPYYMSAFLISSLTAVINFLLLSFVGYKVSGFIFLFCILIISLFYKKGPIFFTSLIYALIWTFFFLPSEELFILNEDVILLALYFLTAIFTGILIDRERESKELLIKKEQSTRALYDIFKQLGTAPSREEGLKALQLQLNTLFKGSFDIILKNIQEGLSPNFTSALVNDEKEKAAAIWVFNNGKEAGWSTSTLPGVKNFYLPIKGFHETLGVLIFKPQSKAFLTFEEKDFLYTVLGQLGNYLEKAFTEEKAQLLEQSNQKEKIYQDVLYSISSGLENPLFSIQEAVYEAVQTLKEGPTNKLEKKEIDKQIHKLEHSSNRLLHILESVFTMAKLGGKIIPLNKNYSNIEDVIQACHQSIQPLLEKRTLNLQLEKELPLICFDYSLIEILIHNLLKNAVQNSPSDSKITIEVKTSKQFLILSVLDEGQGIPSDKIEAIFKKFYKLPESNQSGVGLGLAIAKKIALSHNGDLKVENIPGKGAKFSLFLPIQTEP